MFATAARYTVMVVGEGTEQIMKRWNSSDPFVRRSTPEAVTLPARGRAASDTLWRRIPKFAAVAAERPTARHQVRIRLVS
jgi:hypothetical protein